jgi:hypothetical protein
MKLNNTETSVTLDKPSLHAVTSPAFFATGELPLVGGPFIQLKALL